MPGESVAVSFSSVVVPVFNDPDRIRALLERLADQTVPADEYEILVVDNGSSPALQRLPDWPDNARLLHEPMPGSYAARNLAISEARGDVFAFIDSDCLPDSNWLRVGRDSILADRRLGGLCGPVDVYPKNPLKYTLAEKHDRAFAFPMRHYVEEDHFVGAGNTFTRRDVIDEVGPFDSALRSGGDREWGNRVHGAGYRLSYVETLRVLHPARHRLQELLQKARRVGAGAQWLESERSPSSAAARLARKFFRPPLRSFVFRSWALPDRGFKERVELVTVLLLMHYSNTWSRLVFQVTGARPR